MIKWILLLNILTLSGCINSNLWYVDDRFTPEEAIQIQLGANMWDRATTGIIHFELLFNQKVDIADISRRVIVKTTSRATSNVIQKNVEGHGAHWFREYNREFIVFYTDNPETWETLPQIAAHEFGHSLDLKHTNYSGPIMWKEINPEACITQNDLDQLHSHLTYDRSLDHPCDRITDNHVLSISSTTP